MSEGKELLAYYQDKIDQLYKERLAWLSKFDQCNILLKEKQKLMDTLKDHKDKQLDLNRGIIHHDVVLLDQKLNVIRMERQNINNDYADAQQILKMQELMEEYPQQLQKHLPCKILTSGADIINNQLNIHATSKEIKKNNFNLFRQSNSVLSGKNEKEKQKIKYKPSKDELLKRQIIELKANQSKELCLLKEQKRKLQDLLKSVRNKQEQVLNNQRDIVEKLRNQYKKQEQRHRQLSEKYFDCRKKLKQEQSQTKTEGQRLKETLASLQKKVSQEMRIYQKQNKAKQTLIVRKSQDFQEDYKARMRAKQHNLQALRDNYEKMQDVCIQKIKKLQETLTIAKHRLNETEQKRQQEISQLKKELFALQKQVGEERAEKAKIDQQMRLKIEEGKRKRLILQQKEEEERRKFQKAKQIQVAYKKTNKPERTMKPKKKHNEKSQKKLSSKKHQSSQEEESDEQSMAMSDLENINQQINKLSSKLENKQKKSK